MMRGCYLSRASPTGRYGPLHLHTLTGLALLEKRSDDLVRVRIDPDLLVP